MALWIDIPWSPACMTAFCSACMARQTSCFSPDTIPLSSLKQPSSRQSLTPEGAPLYPVVRMRLSLTMTAPTWCRLHVERSATRKAILAKYSSQGSLCCEGSLCCDCCDRTLTASPPSYLFEFEFVPWESLHFNTPEEVIVKRACQYIQHYRRNKRRRVGVAFY